MQPCEVPFLTQNLPMDTERRAWRTNGVRSRGRPTHAAEAANIPLDRMLNSEPEGVAELVTEEENVFADSRKQMLGSAIPWWLTTNRSAVRFTARAGSGAAGIGECERNKSG